MRYHSQRGCDRSRRTYSIGRGNGDVQPASSRKPLDMCRLSLGLAGAVAGLSCLEERKRLKARVGKYPRRLPGSSPLCSCCTTSSLFCLHRFCMMSNSVLRRVVGEGGLSWSGSVVLREEFDRLVDLRFTPCSHLCAWRVPDPERIPRPLHSECVLFTHHLESGLTPPAHPFLKQLLRLYGLQLHHLTPDCITHPASSR